MLRTQCKVEVEAQGRGQQLDVERRTSTSVLHSAPPALPGCVCGAGGGFHLWFTSDKAPQWKGKIAGSGIGRSGARPPILSSPVAACLSLWYHRHNLNVAILTSARGTVRRRQLHS